MTTWVKPGGMELELNDEEGTITAAVELGWKPKEVEAVKKVDAPKK